MESSSFNACKSSSSSSWRSLVALFFMTTGTGTTLALTTTRRNQANNKSPASAFEDFNRLFADATLVLPDADLTKDWGSGVFAISLSLTIRNLQCRNIVLDDLQMTWNETNPSLLSATLTVHPFALDCTADYTYRATRLIRGSGRFTARSHQNSFATTVTFGSPSSFAQGPPTESFVTDCQSKLDIYSIDFDGRGPGTRVLNWVELMIDDVIERNIQSVLCSKVTEADGALDEQLRNMADRIEPWLTTKPVGSSEDGAVAQEEQVVAKVPSGVTLLDLKTNKWVDRIFTQVDASLGTMQEDRVGGGPDDLGINLWFRNQILTTDDSNENSKKLVLDIASADDIVNPVLWNGHDQLTQSNITVKKVEIAGLDSLRTFQPLVAISNYTLANRMMWRDLSVTAHLKVDILPSTKQDSMFLPQSQPTRVSEDISVSISFQEIDLDASILAAVNKDTLSTIELGSVLVSEQLWNCAMSVIHTLDLSGLTAKVDSISQDPTLEGFVSPGIDDLVTTAVEAALVMYEPTLLRALPKASQNMLRDVLSAQVFEGMRDGSETCPLTEWPNGSINFYKLLNDDKGPYGDLAAQAYTAMIESFSELEKDGLPGINEVLIRPLTSAQSNQAGSLVFPEPFVSLDRSINGSGVERFEFALSHGVVENLDTLSAPFKLLEPSRDSPTALQNSITIGGGKKDGLRLGVRMLIDLEGEAPLNMRNEIDLGLSVDTLSMSGDIDAHLNSASVRSFPLGDIVNLDCWLAKFHNEQGDELSLENLAATVSGLSLSANCYECTSPSQDFIPELISVVQENGLSDVLELRLPNFVVDLLGSDWFKNATSHRAGRAATACPSHEEYNPDTVDDQIRLRAPILTAEALDTVSYLGIVSSWLAFLTFAEDIKQQAPVLENDPLMVELFFSQTEGSFVDWNDIGNSTGIGPMADEAFLEARTFLNGTNANGTLNLISLLQQLMDGEMGELSLDTDGLTYERAGYVVAVTSIQLKGLDTFSTVDVLNPIGSYTLDNRLVMDSLNATLGLTIGHADDSAPIQNLEISFQVEDFELHAALFVVFDVDRIKRLKLGSLMETSNIWPCLLSTALDVQLPRVAVSVGQFVDVSFSGLLQDTEDSMNRIIDATRDNFAVAIEEAIPTLFRGAVGGMLSSATGEYVDRATCPGPLGTSSNGLVDLRELLVNGTRSIELGGAGDSPYGNLFSTLLDLLRERFLAEDEDTGFAKVNELLIRPFTASQSGTEGTLAFPGNLFDRKADVDLGSLDAAIRLAAGDAYMRNLDTIGVPLSLLDNVHGEPHTLESRAVVGHIRPTEIGVRLQIELNGADTDIRNDVAVGFSMKEASVLLTNTLRMLEHNFLGLALEDLSEWSCWFYALDAPLLDSRGVKSDDSASPLDILKFALEVASVQLNVTCVDCTGPNMALLEDLVSTESGVTDATRVANILLKYASGLVEGEFMQVFINRLVVDADKTCPSSPNFDPVFTAHKYAGFETPPRSDSVALFLALGVTLFVVGLVIFLGWITLKVCAKRRFNKWLTSESEENLYVHYRQLLLKQQAGLNTDKACTSLFGCPTIPLVLRIFAPMQFTDIFAWAVSDECNQSSFRKVHEEEA